MLLSEGRDFLHGQVVFVSFPEQLFRRVPVAVDEAHDVQGRTVHASPIRRFINRETASVHAEPFRRDAVIGRKQRLPFAGMFRFFRKFFV